jgi:hypothetical protein
MMKNKQTSALGKHVRDKQVFIVYFSICLLTLALSCNRPPCENTNSVFRKYSPESQEYKIELSQQLQTTDNRKLSYWFDRSESRNGNEYILVDIRGDGLCAKGHILVNDWSKLEGIKSARGKGYHGAELKNLKISVERDSTEIEFIYQDLGYIID